jgi:hypothetical protein
MAGRGLNNQGRNRDSVPVSGRSIHWTSEALSAGAKRPGRDVD